MRNLMNLINLKMFTSVAVAVGIAVCLVPQSAQAQIIRRSGSAVFNSNLNFDIDTTVQDQDQADNSRGYFPGAIQNYTRLSLDRSSILESSPLGNLTVSKFTSDATGNVLGLVDTNGLEITLNRLQQLLPDVNFSNDVVRYDVAFPSITSSTNNFSFFIPSNDSNLINNLSDLTQFNELRGILPGVVSPNDNITGTFRLLEQDSSQRVPEPTATAGLLGVGALGVASLVKRNKHLKKTV